MRVLSKLITSILSVRVSWCRMEVVLALGQQGLAARARQGEVRKLSG